MLFRSSMTVNLRFLRQLSFLHSRRPLRAGALGVAALLLAGAAFGPVAAEVPAARRPLGAEANQPDELFLAARDAFRAGDRDRLAALAPRLADHTLAPWVDYWQTQLRLRDDEPAQADAAAAAFFARHPGTYLADRLRMDWLLALGARGELARFAAEQPALIWQHDDHQVRCYAALARYRRDAARALPERVRDARQVLATSREPGGDGCMALAEALIGDGRISPWDRVRALVEGNQLTQAKRLGSLLPRADGAQLTQAIDKPAGFLALHERRLTELQRELALIGIARLARENPEQTARYAAMLNLHLTPEQRGLVWGRIGHMAAVKLMPEAVGWYRLGGEHVGTHIDAVRTDEVLEWQVRAALRGTARGPDWPMVRSTYERMGAELKREPAWIYWNARALAAAGQTEAAQAALRGIAGRYSFYGKLAAEELGEPIVIPPAPPAPEPLAVAQHASNAGFARALKLIELGMRVEGSREWGWQLRNRSDAELLAIAEYARGRNSLDRMIATSERTREAIDFGQRFPAPHREDLERHARAAGVDETWVYGLIRQESRFIADARSSVGAQGLMQLMPTTARYVARRVGMSDYSASRITELDVNLRLGTSYLKFVLDDLDGHPLLASAAYNAGPSRPRAWRAALPRAVEGAIFAETIPFNETRDYVKKVMSNTVYYAALFENRAQSLKDRLGSVAPKAAGSTELP
jgi:soluble lytic murein transglycosylase